MNETSPTITFIPMLLMSIPILIMNIILAKRKGRNAVLYFVISIIPLAGYFAAIFLASLTDKSINDKINRILEMLESKNS
jgi:hypothetical protein